MCRIIKKVSAIICFISQKSCGSTNQHCYIVIGKKSAHFHAAKKLKTAFDKGRDPFVTVEEVANIGMEELKAVFPMTNEEKVLQKQT